MRILHARSVVPILLLSVLPVIGCDDDGRRTLLFNGGFGPSHPPRDPFVSRAVFQPDIAQAQRIGDAVCPAHPPLVAPFTVVFQGDGRTGVFLSDVQMQFVDAMGVRAGSMTLGGPELSARFGSTALPVAGTRTFPFVFPFGCIGLPAGTLTVIVVTDDGSGRRDRTVGRLDIR